MYAASEGVYAASGAPPPWALPPARRSARPHPRSPTSGPTPVRPEALEGPVLSWGEGSFDKLRTNGRCTQRAGGCTQRAGGLPPGLSPRPGAQPVPIPVRPEALEGRVLSRGRGSGQGRGEGSFDKLRTNGACTQRARGCTQRAGRVLSRVPVLLRQAQDERGVYAANGGVYAANGGCPEPRPRPCPELGRRILRQAQDERAVYAASEGVYAASGAPPPCALPPARRSARPHPRSPTLPHPRSP